MRRRALAQAAAHPALGQRRVSLIVVADACSDYTAEAAAALGVAVLEVRAHNVGVARAAGVAELMRQEGGRPLASLWLATTDADSLVPRDWLAGQVALAERGWEVVAGTVRVNDWRQQPARVRHRFTPHYGSAGTGHPHIHGANLGLTAAALVEAGGVPAIALAEDRALVEALHADRRRILRAGHLAVTTSSRRESRTPGGFADFLRDL
ncbi:MAG: glycosyltransferase [Actinomycetota bacterium]